MAFTKTPVLSCKIVVTILLTEWQLCGKSIYNFCEMF